MDIQRLRNLTTGILHTEIGHVYQDIEFITGVNGIMTHQLPNATRSLRPWLRLMVTDERFWDGEFDQTHTGEFELRSMDEDERKAMFTRFGELPSPLSGKEVVPVVVPEENQ